MFEDIFGGDASRTDEVSENGSVNPTGGWPKESDFLARPGVGAAGYTYVGQMFSHDVNKDTTAKLGDVVDANDVSSAATAAADLDTMYGSMDKGKFKMVDVCRGRGKKRNVSAMTSPTEKGPALPTFSMSVTITR
jgi:hypothetical protein